MPRSASCRQLRAVERFPDVKERQSRGDDAPQLWGRRTSGSGLSGVRTAGILPQRRCSSSPENLDREEGSPRRLQAGLWRILAR